MRTLRCLLLGVLCLSVCFAAESWRVEPAQQIAALIEQLNDPDYAVRDAAVAGLARQPAEALPRLEAAREKATPEKRWWIDAAIQQIKIHSRSKPGP